MMANEDELHRCVTEFMLDTCRYTSKMYALQSCFTRAGGNIVERIFMGESDIETFNSGSTAEFYVKPVLSCIGDFDFMHCINGAIVIPVGQTPPTKLPNHHYPVVIVYEITDSHKPGFVYLQQSYILRKNDNGRYVVDKNESIKSVPEFLSNIPTMFFPNAPERIQNVSRRKCFYNDIESTRLLINTASHGFAYNPPVYQLHGPAVQLSSIQESCDPFDLVSCMRCPVWPPQAADWPKRSRTHSWPDPATISTVVINGCDVVKAVHPSCKQDDWMSKHQWRLSFSRAEVTLLNSWTPVQQIVYHMLRFVMKHAFLTEEYDKDPNLPKLCNYHIKTLMLWECEQKPQSWWSAESSLIKLCSSLLHKLSDWVSVKRCQQYFISNCNLLDHFVDDDASLMICNNLRVIAHTSFLLNWFVKNYVLYSASLSMLYEDICASGNLLRVIRAITVYKLSKVPLELYTEYYTIQSSILSILHMCPIDKKWTLPFKKELQSIDLRISEYFVAVTSLYVAYRTSVRSLTEDLLEILWTLFDPCSTAAGYMDGDGSASRGLLSISKAIKLARSCNVCSTSLETLQNEMSKAYLHHSFTYGHESTYCVVHVLLAVLYYKSGHYQAAIDHCKQVLNKTACEQYGLRSIGTEYLPQIDESVDAACGLILFYDRVQKNALNSAKQLQKNKTELPAFTAELLARYLYSQCSTVVNAEGNEVTMYRWHLFRSHRLLLGDVLLFKTTEYRPNTFTKMSSVDGKVPIAGISATSSMDTSLLLTTLEVVALEKLISFRRVMVPEMYSDQVPVMNEFDALYAYKCGLFEECLEMCRSYLNTALHLDCWKDHLFPVAFSEMLVLLDGDFVSLFGVIQLIISPTSFALSMRRLHFTDISLLTLSLYLIVQCQKKLCIDPMYMHDTLQLIRFVHDTRDYARDYKRVLDRLVHKAIYRSLKMCIHD